MQNCIIPFFVSVLIEGQQAWICLIFSHVIVFFMFKTLICTRDMKHICNHAGTLEFIDAPLFFKILLKHCSAFYNEHAGMDISDMITVRRQLVGVFF